MTLESERPLAVVTGASAGIGKEFCERLAARGYDLLVVARDAARLETLRGTLEGRYGNSVDVFPADLTIEDDVTRLVGLIAASPRLTLLVNNAGFGTRGDLADASPAQQEAISHHVQRRSRCRAEGVRHTGSGTLSRLYPIRVPPTHAGG